MCHKVCQQVSAMTWLKIGGIFSDYFVDWRMCQLNKRFLKISQYVPKWWQTLVVYFLDWQCHVAHPAAHLLRQYFFYLFSFYARKQLLLSARFSHRSSVCPSHGWISQKRCKLKSSNLHCWLHEDSIFRNRKAFLWIWRGSPRTRVQNERRVGKICDF